MDISYLGNFKDISRLSNFNLRQICYFIAVVKAGNNFSKAAEHFHAEHLNIEQPHISQKIQLLEKELKVELFNRKTRPLTLTPAGQEFLQEISLALNHLERAIDAAQRANRGEIGRLVVGVNSGISNSLLPDILQTFRQKFPNVHLILRELTADEQVQQIQNNLVDIGFEHIPNSYQQDENLCFLPILQDSLVIALPENHRLASQSQIPLEELKDEPFVLPSSQNAPVLHNQTISLCKDAGFQPKVAQEATWMVTVLGLIAGGIGVALLSSNVRNLKRKGVAYCDIQGENANRKIAVLYRQGEKNSSPILHEFLNVVEEIGVKAEKLEAR